MWIGIIALIGKILDFINPWSKFWVDRLNKSNERKEIAKKEMENAVKDENLDDYWNKWSDRHSAD